MNIFDIIFKNGNSNEVIFSSVYNYLIDRYETHGLRDVFINKIISTLPSVEGKEKFTSSDDIVQIEVEPEHRLKSPDKWVGNIDSYLLLEDKKNQKKYVIATEVKILDSSANNRDSNNEKQIIRYNNALIGEEGISNYIFIFLVPSTSSNICINEFNELLNTKPKPTNCYILFWKKCDTKKIEIEEQYIGESSIESIIEEILSEESKGDINPLSIETKYLLKSLKLFIKNDFNRTLIASEKGIFPSRQDYLKNLPIDHRELYNYIEEIVGKKLQIRTNHTSVGIPYKSNPEPGINNTLFRITTCKNYYKKAEEKEANIVKNLELELNYNIFNNDEYKDRCKKIFNSFAEINTIKEEFHRNGTKNEKVFFIKFNEGLGEELDEIKLKLDEFIVITNERFKDASI